MTSERPAPNSLAARDAAAVLHPYTDALANAADGPLVIDRGQGIYVYDEDGRGYIEGMAGLWCASLGFGVERLADAAARQIRRLGFYHGFNQKSHQPQIELAERLLELAPVPMSKVFFANSGSEAIDLQVDGQIEPCPQLDRQFCRVGTFQDLVHETRGAPEKQQVTPEHTHSVLEPLGCDGRRRSGARPSPCGRTCLLYG